jgi:hypothetical protein
MSQDLSIEPFLFVGRELAIMSKVCYNMLYEWFLLFYNKVKKNH